MVDVMMMDGDAAAQSNEFPQQAAEEGSRKWNPPTSFS
jgi:hypothetical protein